ncbi:hypothetical protein B0T21DRAFT_421626 [Apiosordaria backusii]|uniref:BTB domain-containing protein n=1 Tax=Apiosordaria backusii TaxID=314023 RepID=A0AA40B2A7_9PEZI|nr:hypothetical protein B0T21DRAFT_421626 [Apiosordaria backusii]
MPSESVEIVDGANNPVAAVIESRPVANTLDNNLVVDETADKNLVLQTVNNNHIVEDIDEDGDLILHVGPTSTLKAYKIEASTLRRTSVVFKAKLLGEWSNSKPTDGSQWVVSLPEDDPICLKVVLHIIHGQFDHASEVMAKGDKNMLYDLLVLCDKYDMAYIIKPWASAWFDRTIQDLKDKPSYLKLAFIAWELGRHDLFTESCQHLVLASGLSLGGGLAAYGCHLSRCRLGPLDMEGKNLNCTHDLPLHMLTERMESLRYVIIQNVLDFYHNEVKCRLVGKTPTHIHRQANFSFGSSSQPTPSQPTPSRPQMNKKMCDHLILGGILQATLAQDSTKIEDRDTGYIVLLPKEASEYADSVLSLIGQVTKIFRAVSPLDSGHESCHPEHRFLPFQESIKTFTAECNKGWENCLLRPGDEERLAERKRLFS